MSGPTALRTAGMIASLRPGAASRLRPPGVPSRILKALQPNASRSLASRVASSAGRDVAAHARSVGGQRPHRSAEEHRDGLAGDLSIEIPQRGIDAGQRAAEERPGELQLRVDHRVVDRVDLADVAADDRARDQAMQHFGGDVRLVRRDLPPAGLAVARRDAHERERLAPERLDRLHGQAARHDCPVAIARRPPEIVVRGAARRAIGLIRGGLAMYQRRGGGGERGSADDPLEKATACLSHGTSRNAATVAGVRRAEGAPSAAAPERGFTSASRSPCP